MKDTKLKQLKENGVVAIVRGVERKDILRLTNSLLTGGVKCIEVAFNTPEADRMISDIKKEFGKDALVGAGTITDEETAKIVYEAGAEFILSPSLHRDVIDFCKKNEVISIPGAYTPTEIVMAHKWGADIVKVFPAGIVEPKYIKMLSGPFDNIDMMAVGGINLENVISYINSGCIGVGVGSSLVNKEFIKDNKYDLITEAAKSFIMKIRTARQI